MCIIRGTSLLVCKHTTILRTGSGLQLYHKGWHFNILTQQNSGTAPQLPVMRRPGAPEIRFVQLLILHSVGIKKGVRMLFQILGFLFIFGGGGGNMDIKYFFLSISLKNLKANGVIVFLLVHPYCFSEFCVFGGKKFSARFLRYTLNHQCT